ncbi:MAG: hypothetical protein WCT27_04525 [Patescibacteria group bacterium]|jgi:hypothetical protein
MPFTHHEAIKSWAAEHDPAMLEEVEQILAEPQPNSKRKKGGLLLLELSFEEGRYFQEHCPTETLTPRAPFPSILMWIGFYAGRQFQHDNPDAPLYDPSIYETS